MKFGKLWLLLLGCLLLGALVGCGRGRGSGGGGLSSDDDDDSASADDDDSVSTADDDSGDDDSGDDDTGDDDSGDDDTGDDDSSDDDTGDDDTGDDDTGDDDSGDDSGDDDSGDDDSAGCEEAWISDMGTTLTLNNAFTKGNVVQVTDDVTVTSFAMYLDAPVSGSVTLTIAEGPTSTGPFVALGQGVVDGTGTPEFLVVSPSVALTTGMYYFFGATWPQPTGNYYSPSGTVDPYWGTFVTGAYRSGSSIPGSNWSPTSTPAGAYTMQVLTDEDCDPPIGVSVPNP